MSALDWQGRFKRACRIHTEFAVMRYLMSNAHGRWDGAEKAQRHDELTSYYVAACLGVGLDRARFDHEETYQAIREATRELTDSLDEQIGFPAEGRPDYDRMAPMFFEKFHALAMAAIDKDSQQ